VYFKGQVERDSGAQQPGGQVSFEAAAGTVRVRADRTDASGRSIESGTVTLEVPDFSSVQSQITSAFVFRGRTAREIQQLRASSSPLPTTARTFSRTERLLLRFGAYAPGGITPAVVMRSLYKQGISVASMPTPASTDGQMFESEFGLSAFPPGEYLIEIVADSGGATAKALVAIRVTG
jgi:hypothetical protein